MIEKTGFDVIFYVFLFLIISNQVCQGAKEGNITRYEKVLLQDLLRDYNKEIRPVLDQSELVAMQFEIALSEILDLDEKNQVLTTNVWIRQKWEDNWLRWNSSLYGGITSINIDPLYIWKPDILLYNNVHNNDNGEQYLFKTKVIISHDGTVVWYSPNKLRTFCKIDIKYFPFDTQECKLTFGSWTFTGDKLNLNFLKSTRVDLSKFSKNGEWDLISAEGKRNSIVYPCCPQPFIDLTYSLIIKRRPLFYLNNLIIPCIVLALLTALSFMFPPETGERISLVVTVLLGMTVFMIVFTDLIPATSEVTPLISKYFIAVLVEVSLCLLATCVPLRLQHLHPGTEMPYWAKVVVFDFIGVMMCFRCRRKGKVSDHFSGRNDNNDNKTQLSVENIENGYVDNHDLQHSRTIPIKYENTHNEDVLNSLSTINKYVEKVEREGELYAEWKNAIAIFDRLFFWLFMTTFTASSIAILVVPSLR